MKLIPAIIQDYQTKQVLMLGFMSSASLALTKKEKIVWFWSRKRKKLWKKGETSGNILQVRKIFIDCDNDTLLIKVTLLGKSVCHTGEYSCFFTPYET